MQVLFLYFPIDILHLSCWFKWDRVQFYLSVWLYSSPLFPLSPFLCYLSLVFNDLPPVLFLHHFIFLIVSFLPLSSVLILSSSITLSLYFLSQPAPTTLLSLSLCVCVWDHSCCLLHTLSKMFALIKPSWQMLNCVCQVCDVPTVPQSPGTRAHIGRWSLSGRMLCFLAFSSEMSARQTGCK